MRATCIAALAAIIGLAASALWLGGCVNVDTKGWQGVAREYKDAYSPKGGQDPAIHDAREAAIEAGLSRDALADYSVSASEGHQYWWVEFKDLKSDKKTWPGHFVVRVNDKGETKIYKNPADRPED